MARTEHSVSLLRVVAGVLGVALLLWSVGFPTSLKKAEAASITNASDTLSDSDLAVGANHTIRFTTPNGVMDTQTIVLTFESFTLPTGFDFNDIDVKVGTVDRALGSSASGDIWGVATTSGPNPTIIFTTSSSTGGSATVGSSTQVSIFLGTHASTSGTGNTQPTNPGSADSYAITIAGSMTDSGAVRVAIIDDVLVTANISTNFSFSVGAVNAGLTVNGTTTNGTSTSTTIPFGTTTPAVIKTIAQDLTVTTNAANGFAVTVFESTPLRSSTGADIDDFSDDTDVTTPTAWVAPSAAPSDENTWGHWGMTSEDPQLFGSNLWIAASTTPRTLFSHNSVVNASTTRVGYQLQISNLQEAGDDYSTTLTYIATPTF